MNLSNIKPAAGAVKRKNRLGRGEGTGSGGTAGRGHKGAKSRSGYKRKIGFEGGQMPLQRRVPKFGFKNPFRVEYNAINLDAIQALVDENGISKIDHDVFMAHGLAGKNDLVKILGRGELRAKVEVVAHAFSKTATNAIEAAGGTAVTF